MCSLIVKIVDRVAISAPLGSSVARGHAQLWRMILKIAAVVGWCAKMGLGARMVFVVMLNEAVHGAASTFNQVYSLWMIHGTIWGILPSVYGQKLFVQLALACSVYQVKD
jgi:hypothetical protein